ncbi:uncharacterized protein ColSpa_11931 [Colletotrichum spaethianum]|uniref:Uncharacterized protein n=1 Tax=Colletotrichum spaethianum TaxID=700344 RepID=A0AA37UQ40_9PEZI|nr:uncharacterized protein ColSpa_11931 [Colletotrichum spaethianum]GKT51750.1 hypothetical protein ColSpa_11931 [Colletotrichum spaethianum]
MNRDADLDVAAPHNNAHELPLAQMLHDFGEKQHLRPLYLEFMTVAVQQSPQHKTTESSRRRSHQSRPPLMSNFKPKLPLPLPLPLELALRLD